MPELEFLSLEEEREEGEREPAIMVMMTMMGSQYGWCGKGGGATEG